MIAASYTSYAHSLLPPSLVSSQVGCSVSSSSSSGGSATYSSNSCYSTACRDMCTYYVQNYSLQRSSDGRVYTHELTRSTTVRTKVGSSSATAKM